jgi:hypothetical protein
MNRLIAIALVLAVLLGGLEFATDYGEAFEGTPLIALPAGHQLSDGHDPAEHGLKCDNCHFGGIHLIGLTVPVVAVIPPGAAADIPWRTPPVTATVLSLPERPPIA